jgi:hypothetical protein
MSFGPGSAEKAATQQQQGVTKQAGLNSAMEISKGGGLIDAGSGLLKLGGSTVTPATNFFQTLLSGNRDNTTAMLQPDINRIREGQQNTLNATSTLMPRGGGRAATLFQTPFAANQQIQNLFNGVRSGAAGGLADIGLRQQGLGVQQQGVGANLMGIGNQPLNTQLQGTQNLLQNAMLQRQYANEMWGKVGSGLFNLATTAIPGSSIAGKLGGLFGGGG